MLLSFRYVALFFVPMVCSLPRSALSPTQAKRSEPILTFLAKRNAVSTSQLDLLWSSTLGKHEVRAKQGAVALGWVSGAAVVAMTAATDARVVLFLVLWRRLGININSTAVVSNQVQQ